MKTRAELDSVILGQQRIIQQERKDKQTLIAQLDKLQAEKEKLTEQRDKLIEICWLLAPER